MSTILRIPINLSKKLLVKKRIGDKLKKFKLLGKAKKLSKILIPVFTVILLISPLRSHAEELESCPNPSSSKSKKLRTLGSSMLGLSKCLDPSTTPLQRAIYCTPPCCVLSAITAGCVAEASTPGSRLHWMATACCASSWGTYLFLISTDCDKVIIK